MIELFVSFVYLDITMDEDGILRLLINFDLINCISADTGEPYDVKAPFSAYSKC